MFLSHSLTTNTISPTAIIIIIVTFIIFQMSCMYEPECKFFTYFKADHFQVLPFIYKKGFWVITCLLAPKVLLDYLRPMITIHQIPSHPIPSHPSINI